MGAYQTVQPLTIGELWAVAITLRIVLVENLRRLAQRIMSSRASAPKPTACGPAAGREDTAERQTMMCYDDGSGRCHAFAVQLVQRLRDQDPRSRRH